VSFNPISAAELADVRRILADPDQKDAAFFPRAIVEGLLGALDEDRSPDDLDRFIREQAEKDPAFAQEYMRLHAVALLRAVRALHEPYRCSGDEVDYCAHCSRIAIHPVRYPCDTIAAIGGEDEMDHMLAASSFGSPRARAIAAMTPPEIEAHVAYALMNGGVPMDLRSVYADREGALWMCQGVFQFWDADRSQIPLMVSLDQHGAPLTLGSLLQGRGPLTVVQDGVPTDRAKAYENMMRNVRRMLRLPGN